MKILLLILLAFFLFLQYRLWVGEGSIGHVTRLKQQIAQQQSENERLSRVNQKLIYEVEVLRDGYSGIEEKAREELGLIKEGETFFLFVDRKPDDDKK